MNDQIKTRTGTLRIERRAGTDRRVMVNISKDHGLESLSLIVPAAELLAAIDAAEPEAMRAYLRETVEPESIDLIDGTTLRVTPEQLDAVPEADSAADVDERPGRDDPIERAQLDRAWALELAHRLFPHEPAGQTVRVAAWVIDVAAWVNDGEER